MNAHEGNKPYHCPSCEYACSNPSNLRRHKKAKHGIDNPTVRAVTPAEPNVVQAPAAAANAPGQVDYDQVADAERTKEGEAQGGARKKTKSKKLKSSPANPLPPTKPCSSKSQEATTVDSKEIPIDDPVFEDIITPEVETYYYQGYCYQVLQAAPVEDLDLHNIQTSPVLDQPRAAETLMFEADDADSYAY